MSGRLLGIEDLSVSFGTPEGTARAVDRVSFALDRGETLGVVGESGCGKSVTSLSILGLIPSPPGAIDSGRILFEDRDLLKLDPEDLRRIRGRDISMIFQEPMTSLNPVLPIGRQVAEPLMVHRGLSNAQALLQAAEWLERVKIPAARRRLDDYPHQLSGGMRQRVMIAMALSCNPGLLIADEPTTALDVTVQAQILELMLDLQKKIIMSIMMITHNLGVIAEVADRVIVMYCGKIVESADVRSIFHNPLHPYTRQLLASVPHLGIDQTRLQEIPGVVPNLYNLPPGCDFHPRCAEAAESCKLQPPGLNEMESGHWVACGRAAGRGA
jgi:oligopeptide/dipeptide ABC transporter ATP-binding protein